MDGVDAQHGPLVREPLTYSAQELRLQNFGFGGLKVLVAARVQCRFLEVLKPGRQHRSSFCLIPEHFFKLCNFTRLYVVNDHVFNVVQSSRRTLMFLRNDTLTLIENRALPYSPCVINAVLINGLKVAEDSRRVAEQTFAIDLRK